MTNNSLLHNSGEDFCDGNGAEVRKPVLLSLVLGLVLEAPRGQVFKSLVLVLVLVLLGPVLVLVLVLPKRSCTGLEIERTEK